MTAVAPTGVHRLEASDWREVARIYEAGIATGNATFETTAPSWEDWRGAHRDDLCFVAVDMSDAVLGWVAAAGVSDRCCYAGVVENSVYIDPDRQGRGLGRQLLTTLIEATEDLGSWTIQTGIFPENLASVALHLSCGFREVGRRRAPRRARRSLARCAAARTPEPPHRLTPIRPRAHPLWTLA